MAVLEDQVLPNVRKIWMPQPGPHLDETGTGLIRVSLQNDESAWFGHEPPLLSARLDPTRKPSTIEEKS